MDTAAVLELIHEVAETVVTPRWRALGEAEVSEKGPGDYVTVADHEAEVALTEALSRAHPDALVVGEEAVSADASVLDGLGEVEQAWLIDPIDGTGNFVRGSADHALMVAELRRGETVRGWIHQPQHQRSFVVERGAGVTVDGTLLPARTVDADPSGWRGVSSRPRWRDETFPPLAPIGSTWWCCGIDYPQLLTGEIDFVVYAAPKPWDHAPGTLMVRELGGEARLLTGERYRPALGGAPLVVGVAPDLTSAVVDTLAPR